MDFLSTDSLSLLGRITTVESTHAQSYKFHLCGLLFQHSNSLLNHRFQDLKKNHHKIKSPHFLSTWERKKKKKTKKILHLISVKTKVQQTKPGLRMTRCFFINPDWMKIVGIKTPWFWQTLATQDIAPAITNAGNI